MNDFKVGDIVNFAKAYSFRFVENGKVNDWDKEKLDKGKNYVGKIVSIDHSKEFPYEYQEWYNGEFLEGSSDATKKEFLTLVKVTFEETWEHVKKEIAEKEGIE